MEEVYMPEKEPFVSDEINFADYFNNYSERLIWSNLGSITSCKKLSIKNLLETDDDTYAELGRSCSLTGFKLKSENGQLVIPVEGFRSDFNGYKIPANVNNLASINALKKRTTKDKIQLAKKLRYTGEKDLEDCIIREEDDKIEEDMNTFKEFLFTCRIYLPAKHRSFLLSNEKWNKPKPLHVNQEFLIPGMSTLDTLKDRIICQGDFQSAEGDISGYPWTETTNRLMDVFKSSMFYIGNTFYIDKRYSTCKDYSAPIIEWGNRKHVKFGEVKSMEETNFCQLKIRLGYPYLFMHLSNCEHLIIFTDARLLHPRDVHVYDAYPIMKGFANLRGRYCKVCRRRLAKYIVTESDRLPYNKMFLCSYCLYLFNYIGYQKDGNFKVYKYVDRTALL